MTTQNDKLTLFHRNFFFYAFFGTCRKKVDFEKCCWPMLCLMWCVRNVFVVQTWTESRKKSSNCLAVVLIETSLNSFAVERLKMREIYRQFVRNWRNRSARNDLKNRCWGNFWLVLDENHYLWIQFWPLASQANVFSTVATCQVPLTQFYTFEIQSWLESESEKSIFSFLFFSSSLNSFFNFSTVLCNPAIRCSAFSFLHNAISEHWFFWWNICGCG